MFVYKPQLKEIHNVNGKAAFTAVEEGNICIDSQFQIIT